MLDILSVFFICIGFMVVVLTIKEIYMKKYEMGHGKIVLDSNLIIGLYCIIIGSLSISNIVSERTFVNLMLILFLFQYFLRLQKEKNKVINITR